MKLFILLLLRLILMSYPKGKNKIIKYRTSTFYLCDKSSQSQLINSLVNDGRFRRHAVCFASLIFIIFAMA